MSDQLQMTDGMHIIVEALKQNNIDTIYGVVGIPVTDMARHAQAEGIRYIGFRHEQSAGYAAAASGFLTQKPGICLTVSAPGFLNGLTALANATVNGFPMIMISGSSDRAIVDLQQGDYEELDQMNAAKPYAKAAFAYASEQNATDAWSNALQLLSAAVQDEAFSAYLNRPELTPAEQVGLFAKVLGEDQSQSVSNFLTLLADNDRLVLLPEIAAEYELLKSQNNNTLEVEIESAFPMDATQEHILAHALEKRFNRTVHVTVSVNPALIAGVVIRAGDQVIDDSALNKLEKMRTRLLA